MDLFFEQKKTLETKRLKYNFLSRFLFFSMDLFYGKKRTLIKFKILELLARIPYQIWEQATYHAITLKYKNTSTVNKLNKFLQKSRNQQDNEQWHLLIIQELIDKLKIKENFFIHWLIPLMAAVGYRIISWIIYLFNPRTSFMLNAYFEDHAEHEYMLFVQENPHFDHIMFESIFKSYYGNYNTYGEVFRRIGIDEREHKEESLKYLLD